MGSSTGNSQEGTYRHLIPSSPEIPEALNFLKELVEAGKLNAVIDRCYAFEELVQAHRYVEKGRKKGNA